MILKKSRLLSLYSMNYAVKFLWQCHTFVDWLNLILVELNLCGNNISTLPDELGLMEDLNALDLSGNKLREFPSACCGMKR
jgi:hypothetical protein